MAYIFSARGLLAKGDTAGASAAAARAQGWVSALTRKDQTVALWRGYLLGGARLVGIRIAAQKARSVAELRDALRPAVVEADRLLALRTPQVPDLQLDRVTADALTLAGDYELLAGRPDRAQGRWFRSAEVCRCPQAPGAPPAKGSGAPRDDTAASRVAEALALQRSRDDAGRRLADIKQRWLGLYVW